MFISEAYSNYLKTRLENVDPVIVKSALEDLCENNRRGKRIFPKAKNGIETTVVGVLGTMAQHRKVQMWSLNALKHIGTKERAIRPVVKALNDTGGNIQVQAAGAACLYTLSNTAHDIIKKQTPVTRKVEYLAAAQILKPDDIPFKAPTIYINKDKSDVVKTAILLEGFGKAVPNLFHPNHTNITLLRELMCHDDEKIVQYCYWALAENGRYSFSDIPVNIPDIFTMPDNVRVWVYRLVAEAARDAKFIAELFVQCTKDTYSKARESLSKGLLLVYNVNLGPDVINWFVNEPNEYTKNNLLFHMARFSNENDDYKQIILHEYGNLNSQLKESILELVKGTEVYQKLILSNSQFSLSFSGDLVMGNKVNVSEVSGNNVNISGGDGKIKQILQIPDARLPELESHIGEIEVLLEELPAEDSSEEMVKIAAAKEDIKKVKALPSKDNIDGLVEKLQWLDEKYTAIADLNIGDKVKQLGGWALKLLALFGAGSP